MASQPEDRPPIQHGLTALILALCLVMAVFGCGGPAEPKGQQVMVYAAASLRDALFDLAGEFRDASGIEANFNLAGSNVLALQIDAAPAADVFLSADEQWMDFLADRGRIDPATRRVFLSNQLVIVVNRDHPLRQLDPGTLASEQFRFLSVADPEAVPAGRYAQQFLRSISVDGTELWSLLEERIVPAPDVRAALGLVAAEPDIAGIVYRTDARSSDEVRVVFEVPLELGPAIRYVAAAVRGSPNPDGGMRFLNFLQSPRATGIFAKHGFSANPVAAQ